MSSFEEKLAAAKKSEPKFQVVTVSLDPDLAEKRAELEAQIEEAKKGPKDDRLGLKSKLDGIREQLAELQTQEADYLVDLKVTRAPGDEWSSVSAFYPGRPGVPLDRRYGFNLHALTAAEGYRWVTRLEGDEWVPFAFKPADGKRPEVNQFADLCKVLAGGDLLQVVDAVFELNVWEPQQRRDRLGKLREGRRQSPSD